MNKKHTDKLNQWKDKVKTSKERNYNFETVSGKNNELLYYPSEISDKYIEKLGKKRKYLHMCEQCSNILGKGK